MFTFKLFPKTFTAETLASAAAQFCEAREACGRGASTMPVPVIYRDGAEFARFSYNGKIWPLQEWTPALEPIFNPYAN